MNKQMSLSFIHDELKEVKTHKREFLEKMDAILPWEQLYELVNNFLDGYTIADLLPPEQTGDDYVI